MDNMIGQFGVGFYSAFIVGNTVEVFSKREYESTAHCWTSDGSGTFSIAEAKNANLHRGTRIVIHLRPEFENFAKNEEIKRIIDKYSNFINHPIYLNHDKINIVEALWALPPAKVKADDYQKFYEYITKGK